MTDKSKPKTGKKKPKIQKLELNKETVQDLTEGEAEAAGGGRKKPPPNVESVIKMLCRSKFCSGKCPNSQGCTFYLPCDPRNSYACKIA